MSVLKMRVLRGAECMVKSIVPSTEPWSTSHFRWLRDDEERVLSIYRKKVHVDDYELRQINGGPDIPNKNAIRWRIASPLSQTA